ncbi:hypothetical protein [Algicella marina]|uniref:Uncharacterized protein n=1 Tax=Algicella marina TaxID=2683284 RepID=A0A6P1T2H7_9RHOB|nr:hypothetical protein [Algicella marina]QHQ37134.1 hypothetical protein GO499_19070 [Algicella marina]
MAKVSIEELRVRRTLAKERQAQLEHRAGPSQRVRWDDHWRHVYAQHPYLLGAPDERIDERFCNVFQNVMELGDNGKIQLVSLHANPEFMEAFTHLLEEYAFRTGGRPPPNLIKCAGAPIKKYFENGTPIGVRMFEGYEAPSRPILVKYGKRRYLEPMLQKGELRLANAGLYNDSGFLDAVRDDETRRTFFLPTYHERLEGKTHLEFQGKKQAYDDDDVVLPLVFGDYYLFSLCESIHHRMPTDFDADAAIVIHNPELFKQRLIGTFLAQRPDFVPAAGRVIYYDPYRDYTKFREPMLAKHFGYAYQKEVRVVMRPKRQSFLPLEPIFLNIGSMSDYAEMVAV